MSSRRFSARRISALLLAAAAMATSSSIASATNVTISASGQAQNSNGTANIAGATVTVGIYANNIFTPTWLYGATAVTNNAAVNTNNYAAVTSAVGNVFGNKDVNYVIRAKKVDVASAYNNVTKTTTITVNGFQGSTGTQTVANPGNGNTANVTANIRMAAITKNFAIPGKVAAEKVSSYSVWDPTYNYDAPSGNLTFGDDVTYNDFSGDTESELEALDEGTNSYADGSQTEVDGSTDNAQSENILGNELNISGLHLLSNSGGTAQFSDGTLSILDPNGNTLMSATISGLSADDSSGGSYFQADLTNAQFPDAANSRLLSEWQSEIAEGGEFIFGLDHQIVNDSAGFTTDDVEASEIFIGVAVPEPTSLGLMLGVGALLASRRRRS